MPLISVESIWEYQTASNSVPLDIEAVSVPSSGWTSGVSPFGEGDAPINLTVANSLWGKGTGLWIRKFIICSGEKEVLVKGRSEQSAFLFWDGEFVGSMNPENLDREDVPEFRIVLDKQLSTSGSHEIAFLCLDDSGTDPEDFSYISVEADYLPVVFPFQPQSPVLERLSWATDVSISRDGTEDRQKLSVAPRQEFKFSYPVGFEKTPRAQNILWGDLKSEILFPVWTQAVSLNSISAGLTTISINTQYSEFRAPGFAIIWSSEDKWQIVGIYEMDSSSITFSNPTISFSRCWIMPVRIGVLSKGVTKVSNGYSSFFELDFLVRDNAQVLGAEPDQYLSDDVYLEETLMSGDSISEDIRINLELFDPGLGEFAFYTGLNRARSFREYRVFCEDQISSWAFRQFLNRRSGRYRQFKEPTFQNDLNITNSGLITNTLQAKKDEYMRSSQGRSRVAIQTASGWLLREIVSVSSISEDLMSLQLSSNINLLKRDIRRISFLGIKRLDTDVIEINHLGAGVSQSSFLVVEIG